MIDRILLAVEDNETRMAPVVKQAAEIAAGVDADVVLFRVYEQTEFDRHLDRMNYDSSDPNDLAKHNRVLEVCASEFVDRGVRPEIAGSVGDPATEIIERVRSDDIDHVFLGGRTRSAVGKAVLGSVSQSVLRSVDVPCTIGMSD